MFFLHEMERVITLHPSYFGPRIKDYLTARLMADVEGTNNGNYYVVCVLDTYEISDGRVVPGIAHAEYTIHFRAVVWRPFKGETVRNPSVLTAAVFETKSCSSSMESSPRFSRPVSLWTLALSPFSYPLK